jgi:isoprene synthase
MECFFWTVGMAFERKLSNLRKGLTKVVALVTTIDDVYDVYGTLDELELFTNAVERLILDKYSSPPPKNK